MRRPFLKSAIWLFCMFLSGALASRAQVAAGTPPFGSFSGGPDVVNNGNLNVHWDFLVDSKAGRGLPLHYTLTYDSAVWSPVTSGSTKSWVKSANWGWGAGVSAGVNGT